MGLFYPLPKWYTKTKKKGGGLSWPYGAFAGGQAAEKPPGSAKK
jgi:hypothetical protein